MSLRFSSSDILFSNKCLCISPVRQKILLLVGNFNESNKNCNR